MIPKIIQLKDCEKKGNKYFYRNRWWIPNQPIKSTRKDKKMMVLAMKMIRGKPCGKIVHFGGNKLNQFPQDVWSALYWSNQWPNQQGALKNIGKKNRPNKRRAA